MKNHLSLLTLHVVILLAGSAWARCAPPAAPLTFEEALQLALANRPTFEAARARVESARDVRAGLLAPPPLRLALQATSSPPTFGNDDAIVLSQPVDLFGRRRANRTLGDAQILLAEAQLRSVFAEVQADVVDRYVDAVAAKGLAASASDQLALAERLLQATRQRADGGIIAPVQVKRVAIEVERARQTLALRQAAQLAALRRLAGALGVPETRIQVGDFPSLSTNPVDAPTLGRQRADLLALAAQATLAQASVGVRRLELRPDFELSARPSGLRAMLSIPLSDYGRTRNEVRAGEANARAERRLLADATARAQAELDAVNGELAAAKLQREGFGRLLADSRELVRISEVGYREGASTLLEVLEATRSLREVEESLVGSRLRVAQAEAAYLRTTGTLLFLPPPGNSPRDTPRIGGNSR